MGVKKRVFASNSERENFYKLRRNWGDKYHLFHNLPFLNVFEGTTIPRRQEELSHQEFNRLKKTSIDYTLCNEDDEPLMAIDFDGMQDGFNVGTQYRHNVDPTLSSPWRQEITELKLRVAHGNLFPYFVVGADHFKDLTAEAKITIVDGIVGEVLAKRAVSTKVAGGFDPEEGGWTEDEFSALLPSEQHEIIQDWVFQIEVIADFEHNPIWSAVERLSQQLRHSGGTTQTLRYPPYDPSKPPLENWSSITLFGSKCIIKDQRFGDIVRTAWIPNFDAPGFAGLELVKMIAQLLALESLRKLTEGEKRKNR